MSIQVTQKINVPILQNPRLTIPQQWVCGGRYYPMSTGMGVPLGSNTENRSFFFSCTYLVQLVQNNKLIEKPSQIHSSIVFVKKSQT
jgi:hypothetical protein